MWPVSSYQHFMTLMREKSNSFPLENSDRLSVAPSMWVATPLPTISIWKAFGAPVHTGSVHKSADSSPPIAVWVKPTPETRFHPRCLHRVLSFCSVSRSVSVQNQAAAMCGQVARCKEASHSGKANYLRTNCCLLCQIILDKIIIINKKGHLRLGFR